MTAPKPLILRVAAVIFAVSLVSGYVVYSQTRARVPVVRGTKSTRILEDLRQIDAKAAASPKAINWDLYALNRAPDGNATKPSSFDLAGSWIGEMTAIPSTKSARILSARDLPPFEWRKLHLYFDSPRPVPIPLVNSPTKGAVPPIAEDLILPPPTP